MLFGVSAEDLEVLSSYKISTFSDVQENSWFMPYVMWGASQEIVKGTTDKDFSPNEKITREQMAVMLDRFIKIKKYNLDKVVQEISFVDSKEIAIWASDAVKNIQTVGIVNGKGNNKFDPKGNVTRAEAAKVVAEILKKHTLSK